MIPIPSSFDRESRLDGDCLNTGYGALTVELQLHECRLTGLLRTGVGSGWSKRLAVSVPPAG